MDGMWDPNDPGYLLDRESFRRMIQGIVRTEMEPYNSENEEVYTTRRHNDKYRLVRGKATANWSGPIIRIKNIVVLAGGIDPSGGDAEFVLRVANIYYPRSVSTNQFVDAIYSPEAISSSNPDSDGEAVDWETLETGSAGTGESLRRFEIASNKLSTTPSVPVYWLDNSSVRLTGSDELVYDPEGLYSGRVTGYRVNEYGTHFGDGFHGIAFLRQEMGTGAGTLGGVQRWEMAAMEGFSDIVQLQYNGLSWNLQAAFGEQWHRKQPVEVGFPVTLVDPLALTTGATAGQAVLAKLIYPDTDPPTYTVIAKTGTDTDRKVAAGTGDTVPATLIEKVSPLGAYDSEVFDLVQFQEFDDGGTRKVRAFIDVVGGSGGGPGVEKRRLIRGQTLALVQTQNASFNIDRVFILAGGIDPRVIPGDLTETIQIFNVNAENLEADTQVTAIWNAGNTRWEMLVVERYRLIKGRVTQDYTSSDVVINIDQIVPLAYGLDPRSDPTDNTETVLIENALGRSFIENQIIFAAFSALTSTWEPIYDEKYRAIRGICVVTGAVLQIDNVLALDSGLDPRNDPTDDTEQIAVDNLGGDIYKVGDTVVADFNLTALGWEARPKDSKVASGPTDDSPATLIQKLHNTGVFNDATQDLVTFEEFDDAGVRKVRGFYTPGAGTSGTDSYKVMVTGTDTVPDYLWDSMMDQGNYDPETHQLAYAMPVDAGGGDQRLRVFTAKGTGGGSGTGTAMNINSLTGLSLGFGTDNNLYVYGNYDVVRVTGVVIGTGQFAASVTTIACGTGTA